MWNFTDMNRPYITSICSFEQIRHCHHCVAVCLLCSAIVCSSIVLSQSLESLEARGKAVIMEETARKSKTMYIVYLCQRHLKLTLLDLEQNLRNVLLKWNLLVNWGLILPYFSLTSQKVVHKKKGEWWLFIYSVLRHVFL